MGQLGTKAAGSDRPVETGRLDTAAARVHNWTFAAAAALGWALFTLVILHLVSSVDPVTDPVSKYAFTDNGQGMLEASLLSFAVGVVAVRGALLSSGVRVNHTATLLVTGTAAGLVAAALFPATYTPDIDPVSGLIHQYGSVIAFLCLPGIAVCLIDQLRDSESLTSARRLLINLVWVCVSGLALFGLTYLADRITLDLPLASTVLSLLGSLPVGLLQRVVFVLDFLLLIALLVLANRAARDPH